MIPDFELDAATGLWTWPVLLDGASKNSIAPCAVLFGRSQFYSESLKHIVGLNLPARWPHLKTFALGGSLLVLAQDYSQEQALLFAEDVNRQLRVVQSEERDLSLTWGVTVPEDDKWNLPDALAEAILLARRAEEGRLGSINIADHGWQNNVPDDLVVYTARDRIANLWSWRSAIAMRLGLDGEPLTLLFGDIDRFKTINECLGHIYGDELLQLIGDILRSIEYVDLAAFRLSADHFIVLGRQCSVERAEHIACQVNRQLQEKLSNGALKGQVIGVTLTWGIVRSTEVQLETMLQQADELVLAAKTANQRGTINS